MRSQITEEITFREPEILPARMERGKLNTWCTAAGIAAFAPGAGNSLRMGEPIRDGRLAQRQARAIEECDGVGRRREPGLRQGGPHMAKPVADAFRSGGDVRPA